MHCKSSFHVCDFSWYTKSFLYPHKYKSEDVKFSKWGGQPCRPPRPIQQFLYYCFKYCVTCRPTWGAVPLYCSHMFNLVWRGMSSKRSGSSSCRKCRQQSLVKHPSRMSGPVSWSSIWLHRTFTEKLCWKLFAVKWCRLLGNHTWVLWQMVICVNWASSQNQICFTSQHCSTVQWQKSTHAV
jgi:hypothetical protein